MKKLILIMSLFVAVSSLEAKPKKNRDRLRLGYDRVHVKQVGSGVDGRTYIDCSGAGDMKCRSNPTISIGTYDDFEFETDLNVSEKIEAQRILDIADNNIDNGEANGTVSETITFYNNDTGVTYYRTFVATWSTNADGEILLDFEYTEPTTLNNN